ncbi:MAG: pilin [Patescibacteria group bacterium]|nr:pilin [Patescibacteria group bacterium]
MRRLIPLFAGIVLLCVVFFATPATNAQSAPSAPNCIPGKTDTKRYADCDVCGYCRIRRQAVEGEPTPVQVPGNWRECVRCIYPSIPPDAEATDNLTLRVCNDPNSPYYNVAVTPKAGAYYTQLGCILTDYRDFTRRGAAGNVVNILLRNIFTIAGGVAFLYLIFGAYVIMTAKGDPMALNRGRSIVYGAIVGLLFILLVTVILNFIGGGILRIPGFGG